MKRRQIDADPAPLQDFPGYQAGASLKPTSLRRCGRCRRRRLPRLPSRGLIEAGRRRPIAHTNRRYFPGYQAGASLKRPFAPKRSRRARCHFPGYQAGASLKQRGDQLDRPLASPELPRLPSRGLIEAPESVRSAIPSCTYFPGYQAGASLKRACGCPAIRESGSTSPVTKPGPH